MFIIRGKPQIVLVIYKFSFRGVAFLENPTAFCPSLNYGIFSLLTFPGREWYEKTLAQTWILALM